MYKMQSSKKSWKDLKSQQSKENLPICFDLRKDLLLSVSTGSQSGRLVLPVPLRHIKKQVEHSVSRRSGGFLVQLNEEEVGIVPKSELELNSCVKHPKRVNPKSEQTEMGQCTGWYPDIIFFVLRSYFKFHF